MVLLIRAPEDFGHDATISVAIVRSILVRALMLAIEPRSLRRGVIGHATILWSDGSCLLSYTSADKPFVRLNASALRTAGHDTCRDEQNI